MRIIEQTDSGALMSCSTSSCQTERLTQLWQSELKKRVKEEIKEEIESMGGKKTPDIGIITRGAPHEQFKINQTPKKIL